MERAFDRTRSTSTATSTSSWSWPTAVLVSTCGSTARPRARSPRPRRPRRGNWGRDRPVENPWRRLASRQAHANPWFRVRHDRVVRPDGHGGDWYVVEAEGNAAAVAVDDQGAVVLVRDWAYPVEAWSWSVPSGGV